jgi:hypothetical protein
VPVTSAKPNSSWLYNRSFAISFMKNYHQSL